MRVVLELVRLQLLVMRKQLDQAKEAVLLMVDLLQQVDREVAKLSQQAPEQLLEQEQDQEVPKLVQGLQFQGHLQVLDQELHLQVALALQQGQDKEVEVLLELEDLEQVGLVPDKLAQQAPARLQAVDKEVAQLILVVKIVEILRLLVLDQVQPRLVELELLQVQDKEVEAVAVEQVDLHRQVDKDQVMLQALVMELHQAVDQEVVLLALAAEDHKQVGLEVLKPAQLEAALLQEVVLAAVQLITLEI